MSELKIFTNRDFNLVRFPSSKGTSPLKLLMPRLLMINNYATLSDAIDLEQIYVFEKSEMY